MVNRINQVKKAGSTKGVASVVESIDGLVTKLNQLKDKVRRYGIWQLSIVPEDA